MTSFNTINTYINAGFTPGQVIETFTVLHSAMTTVFSEGHTHFTVGQAVKILGYNSNHMPVLAFTCGEIHPPLVFDLTPGGVNDSLELATSKWKFAPPVYSREMETINRAASEAKSILFFINTSKI